ncbi:MAG: hypothetical protein IJA88_03690 [Clostridia bacterium]|nr:hypothetical protein [Clostridia bacterium]
MFVNIPDMINAVNKVYHLSVEVDALERGERELENILTNMQPNPKNREDAQALLYRVGAKARAHKYFCGGYLEEDYSSLISYLEEIEKKAEQSGYAKTLALIQNLIQIAKHIHGVMDGAESAIYQVRDENGNPTTPEISVLQSFIDNFLKRIEQLESLPSTENVFGEKVKSEDFKKNALCDLQDIVDWTNDAIKELRGTVNDEFFKTHTKTLDQENGLKFFDYQPSLPDKSATKANAIVIMSPLRDEVLLFCKAYEKAYSLSFISMHVSVFSGKDEQFIIDAFNEFADRKLSILLYGVSSYHDENKNLLLSTLLKFAKDGNSIIIEDERGDRKVYDVLYQIANDCEGLDALDVSYKYLTMPNYNATIEELEQKGMINGAEYSFVQKNMPFMGFVGLNTAVSLFVQGKDWKSVAKDISDSHYSQAQSYLRNLPTQAQFIDVGWINLQLGRAVEKTRGEFDYDTVKSVNPNNIRKILALNANLFVKCGLIVKYCCIAGDDQSVWQGLPTAEKSARLSDATSLISHLLGNEYHPQVEVIPVDKWEDKSAGGMCCDGGKRIIYREDCCNSFDWAIDAVCHECYHAFQHTLQHHGWQEWHWAELGVTEYRVPEWDYNFSNYKSSSHGVTYRVQVVESDARAFAKDCIMQSTGHWHLVDWE